MLSPETHTIQTKLGEYCRTGVLPGIPGIHIEHIKHYRRLVFNIVSNNIRQAFPISGKVIDWTVFKEMIDEFFREHDALSSQIWKLPGEFYTYALKSSWSEKYKLPWLNDLLLLEWTELKVFTMPDGLVEAVAREGNLFKDALVFNPDHEIIQLVYPVHLTSVSLASEQAGTYFLLIFRDRESGKVHFINLGPFFAYFLQRVIDKDGSVEDILDESITLFRIADREKHTEQCVSFLNDLKSQGYILGSKI